MFFETRFFEASFGFILSRAVKGESAGAQGEGEDRGEEVHV